MTVLTVVLSLTVHRLWDVKQLTLEVMGPTFQAASCQELIIPIQKIKEHVLPAHGFMVQNSIIPITQGPASMAVQ